MPLVVGRAVHLHPLVPIFAVLTGGSIAGVLGAVLAVPVAAAVRVTLDFLFPAEPDPVPEAGSAPAADAAPPVDAAPPPDAAAPGSLSVPGRSAP